MLGEHLSFDIAQEIGTAVLNRPENGNAFDWNTIKEMDEVLCRVQHDENIKGLIITAKGEKYFCLGADINLMESIQGKEYSEFLLAGLRMTEKIQRCPKPTIAAINGIAVGAGAEICMACDLRVASTKAKIGIPELKIGMVPGWGGVLRLTRLVGQAKAMEIVLTAEHVTAEAAEKCGLVNTVVQSADLSQEARNLMHRILANAPLGITLAKFIVRGATEMPVYIGEQCEAMSSILTFLSQDGKEGMEAFFQKRKPVWSGT